MPYVKQVWPDATRQDSLGARLNYMEEGIYQASLGGGGGGPTGPAGGGLSGTYPNPTVASISGIAAGGDLSGSYPNPTITNIANAPIYNSNTTLSFRTSGTERMSIDASGRVRTPNQPICQLYRTSNTPGGNAITWTGTYVNIGSMWNGTTTVTVPVSGTYLVTFEGMSTLTTNVQFYMDIWKNGAWIGTLRQYHYTSGTAHKHLSVHAYLSLAANDYIWWVPGTEAYGDGSGYCHGSLALVA